MGRDQLEHAACLVVQARDAPVDHRLERGARVGDEGTRVQRQSLRLDAPGQILHEERTPSRASRDRLRYALRPLVRAEDGQSEAARVVHVERREGDVAQVDSLETVLSQLDEERAVVVFSAIAVAQDDEDRRRSRRARDLAKEHRAVDVAPLHVVEVQDRRTELRELREDRAERQWNAR